MVGELAVEERRERLPAHRRRLRNPQKQQIRRSSRVTRRTEGDSNRSERTNRRAIRVPLNGTSGNRPRSRRDNQRTPTHALSAVYELGLASLPHATPGLQLPHRSDTVRDVDDEAKRTLAQRRRQRVGRHQHHVRSRTPQPVLEKPPHPGLAVRQGNNTRDLGGDAHHAQHLHASRDADTDNVGDDGKDRRAGSARNLPDGPGDREGNARHPRRACPQRSRSCQ